MSVLDHLEQRLPWAIESRWRYLAFHAFFAMLAYFALGIITRGVWQDVPRALIAAVGYTAVEKIGDYLVEPQNWGSVWPELGDLACDTWTAGLVVALVAAAHAPPVAAAIILAGWLWIFSGVQWWSRP